MDNNSLRDNSENGEQLTFADGVACVAARLLTTATDDYAARIWNNIAQDVIADVCECTDDSESDGYTDGDVALAIGRVIAARLSVL